MFKKNFILAATLGLALSTSTLSTSAFAHSDFEADEHENHFKKKMHQQHKKGMRGMDGIHRAFSKLNLTDGQKESLKALKDNNHETIKAVMEEIHPLKKQMHELLSADNVDEAAVKDLSLQIAEKKTAQMLLLASIKKQAVSILTEEQRAEFEAMKTKREERREKYFSKN